MRMRNLRTADSRYLVESTGTGGTGGATAHRSAAWTPLCSSRHAPPIVAAFCDDGSAAPASFCEDQCDAITRRCGASAANLSSNSPITCAISGSRRSSVSIGGYQWRTQVLSGNQSEIISGDLTCASSSSRTARAS